MIFYHVVGLSSAQLCLKQVGPGVSLLFSFARGQDLVRFLGFLDDESLVIDRVLIDSGAYSVASGAATIDLDRYARFLSDVSTSQLARRTVNTIDCVSLDVIPGDEVEPEDSAQQSFDNYVCLRRVGLEPIPVYHYPESRRWLDRMLERSSYIGLGGVSDGSVERNWKWFDEVFSYLEKENVKDLRVHGFGLASPPTLARHPWYSADATTAVLTAANGVVLIPGFGGRGQYDFKNYYCRLKVRERNRPFREQLDQYFGGIGFRYEDIFDYSSRISMNFHFFCGLVRQLNAESQEKTHKSIINP